MSYVADVKFINRLHFDDWNKVFSHGFSYQNVKPYNNELVDVKFINRLHFDDWNKVFSHGFS